MPKDYEYITDHTERAYERLLYEFQELPPNVTTNYHKTFLQAICDRLQEIEDFLNSIYLGRSVLYATGNTLDRVGAMVNQTRVPGQTDDIYRVVILARIAANVSEGTRENIINILRILGATDILIFNLPFAAIQINYRGITILEKSQIIDIIKAGTPPINVEDVSSFTDTPFGFSGDSSAFGFDIGELGL